MHCFGSQENPAPANSENRSLMPFINYCMISFMEEQEKLKSVVEARMKLKARFEEKISANTLCCRCKAHWAQAIPNRHGMPVLPVGQTITKKWPVLDLGVQPDIDIR